MAFFTKKPNLSTMASVVTSLIFVSGCRSASVSSTPGGLFSQGAIGSSPIYKPYSRTADPYGDDSHLSPSPAPEAPSVLPVPGHSEPEVPPAPSATRSKWNFLQSNLKLPSMSRHSNDVSQMGARSDVHGPGFKLRRGKSVTPTLRDDDEENESVGEVVRSRSSSNAEQIEVPPLNSSSEQISEAPMRDVPQAANSSTSIPSLRTPIRARYGAMGNWSASRSGSRAASNESNDDPQLTAPVAIDENSSATQDVPRLLTPND